MMNPITVFQKVKSELSVTDRVLMTIEHTIERYKTYETTD